MSEPNPAPDKFSVAEGDATAAPAATVDLLSEGDVASGNQDGEGQVDGTDDAGQASAEEGDGAEGIEVTPYHRPENAAEAAEWREKLGIPDRPDAYDIAAFGPDDPVAKEFAGLAHNLDLPQEHVGKIGKWYAEKIAAIDAAEEAVNAKLVKSARAELAQAWGEPAKWQTEVAGINCFLGEMLPADLAASIRDAKLPDGSRMFNHAGVLTLFADLARSVYASPEGADAFRISELERSRDTDVEAYFRNGHDKELLALTRKQQAAARQPAAPATTAPAPQARQASPDEVDSEIADLNALMHRDIHEYQNGYWRSSGKTPSQRLLELGRRKTAQQR